MTSLQHATDSGDHGEKVDIVDFGEGGCLHCGCGGRILRWSGLNASTLVKKVNIEETKGIYA